MRRLDNLGLVPRTIGGKWSRDYIRQDPLLRPGFRVEADKWFLQRHWMNPNRRVRVKLSGWDHDHAEFVIWCSCGYRRHAKRGYVGHESQSKYRANKGQSQGDDHDSNGG